MQSASSKNRGRCFAVADSCKTPPYMTPVPYTNIAMLATATKYSQHVNWDHMPALNVQSETFVSNADNPGVGGGVISGVVMNPVWYRRGSSFVRVDGHDAVYHLAPTGHNGKNANTQGVQDQLSSSHVSLAP